jgi:choline dehydrogenase-like flavoprotein
MLPHAGTYVELDYEKKDQFGLPLAKRVLGWSDHDMTLFREMTRWSKDILEASGAEIFAVGEKPQTNHELGGARMGSDPKRSVVNAYCQTHDVPNLFVVDGSVFPSASEKNPTHTIMALAARTADHIAQRAKRGEL